MKKPVKKAVKVFTATHGSPDKQLTLGNRKIQCYVLEDGTPVLSGRGMQEALGLGQSHGTKLQALLNNKAVKPFIDNELAMVLNSPIRFIRPGRGGKVAVGYEATVLSKICRAILDARRKGAFEDNPKMQAIAAECEMLVAAFSDVGIVALVYEITGYEKVKVEDALQQFLQKFLENEKGKWVRTFPPEFFEAIFKMKGWTWKQASTKKPQVVGHYINNFVYARLAPKILQELRERNPKDEKGNRKGKYPQWINPDFGHPKLKEHLSILTAFAKASGYNWKNWERLVERALPKFDSNGSVAQEIDFPEED